MNMTLRHLITTADERTWKFDRPVLFLGEWCRLYDRKHVWENMDAAIAEPYGLDLWQKDRDLIYVQELSHRLLDELVDGLNAYHNARHSLRYWQIVLGHWIQRYVAVTFNRYFALEQAINRNQVSGTTIFDSSHYSLATTDSMAFIRACNDHIWNHVLYSRILDYWEYDKTEIESDALRGLTGFTTAENPKSKHRSAVKGFILSGVNQIMSGLCGKHDAFIMNSYLPLKEEIKLQVSLGQFPQIWRSPAVRYFTPDLGQRKRFHIDAENYTGFECFVRRQLSEMIPACYLEGFDQLTQDVERLPWPSEPRLIFTSNNFDTDEIFKVWAGSKVEKGVPYFVGQHGSYQAKRGHANWSEVVTCDKFLTWGWTNGSSKNLPAFIFKTAGRKSQQWDSGGGLLLVERHLPHRFGPEDSYFEYGVFQEEQFRFAAALPPAIQQQLTVRLKRAYKDVSWSDEQRWKDRSPYTNIETGVVPIRKLIAQSRLVVHSYDSVGIPETLAFNIPTMCFWHGGLDHILPSAKPYYELLRNAGIFADTPEQAAEMISLRWESISEWWENKKVQDAREVFCQEYARTDKTPVKTMKRLLTTNVIIR